MHVFTIIGADDFSPLNEGLNFLTASTQCREISIVTDRLVESMESFLVSIASDDVAVNIEIDEMTVTIIDSDSKFYLHAQLCFCDMVSFLPPTLPSPSLVPALLLPHLLPSTVHQYPFFVIE